jgi:hypothetical protein
MPKCDALHQESRKFGRPHEVDGFAQVDCRRFPRQKVALRTIREDRYGGIHSPGKPSPVQKTSRGAAHGRGARNAHEVAGGRGGERTATAEALAAYMGSISNSLTLGDALGTPPKLSVSAPLSIPLLGGATSYWPPQ